MDRAGQGRERYMIYLVWDGKILTQARCLPFAFPFRVVVDFVCEPMPRCGEVFSDIVL